MDFFQTTQKCKFLRVAMMLACVSLLLLPAYAAQATNTAAVKAEIAKAQAALQAHNGARAQQLFEQVLQVDPANVEAQVNLGVMAFFRGDCVAAESHFRGALKGNASLIKMKALLSVCEMKLDQPQAQADMQSAFQSLKDARLKARLGMQLANLYYGQGNLEQAAHVLQQLLDMQPDNVNYLFFAQRVYSALANGTLNKLAVLAPDSARMEQLIAEHLINDGDLKDAVPHYEKALQLDSHLPGVHFELAEALLRSAPNDPQAQAKAAQQLKQAIQIDGDSANIECELGQIALLQSHAATALTDYRLAYRMNPDNSAAAMGIAKVLEQQGDNQQALKYLRKAVKEDPFNTKANYRLYLLYRKMHLADAAKKQLKLFMDVRDTKNKVESVYHEMRPINHSQ